MVVFDTSVIFLFFFLFLSGKYKRKREMNGIKGINSCFFFFFFLKKYESSCSKTKKPK